MNVVVDSLLTNYTRSGQNGKRPSILIIPGWADTSASWQLIAMQLSKKYDVITINLPGFGGSQAPENAWGLNEYAAFVAHFLQKLTVTPSIIIAHSNGGGVALRGLGTEVLSANKLILIASAGIRNQYNGRNKVLRIITKTGKVLTMPLPQSVKRKLRKRVYEQVGSDMLVAEHMQETFKKVVTDDVQNDADKVDIPTLLIYGQNDTAAPVTYGRIFHEHLPNSTLEIIPDAEHFLHTENTAATIKYIEEFLD